MAPPIPPASGGVPAHPRRPLAGAALAAHNAAQARRVAPAPAGSRVPVGHLPQPIPVVMGLHFGGAHIANQRMLLSLAGPLATRRRGNWSWLWWPVWIMVGLLIGVLLYEVAVIATRQTAAPSVPPHTATAPAPPVHHQHARRGAPRRSALAAAPAAVPVAPPATAATQVFDLRPVGEGLKEVADAVRDLKPARPEPTEASAPTNPCEGLPPAESRRCRLWNQQ